MSLEAEFLELMPATVQIKPWLREDEYTEPSYGPPYPVRARVERTNHEYRTAKGEVRTCTAMVYLFNPAQDIDGVSTPIVPSEKDQVVLPNGETPPVLGMVREMDDEGDWFYVAYLAARAPTG